MVRHNLTKPDFFDFPAHSKLVGKGTAPPRHWELIKREITSYSLYQAKKQNSHIKNIQTTATTTKSLCNHTLFNPEVGNPAPLNVPRRCHLLGDY